MRWIFDLHNQTKNKDLRHSLERITCTLEHTHQVINDNTLNDPRYQIHFETSPRYSQPLDFDVHNDLSVQSNHLDMQQQQQQRNHQKQPHTTVTETVELLNLNPHKLPCEAVTDPTELPLQRESVSGLDIGFKLFSSDVAQITNCVATTVLAAVGALILS